MGLVYQAPSRTFPRTNDFLVCCSQKDLLTPFFPFLSFWCKEVGELRKFFFVDVVCLGFPLVPRFPDLDHGSCRKGVRRARVGLPNKRPTGDDGLLVPSKRRHSRKTDPSYIFFFCLELALMKMLELRSVLMKRRALLGRAQEVSFVVCVNESIFYSFSVIFNMVLSVL